MISDKTFDTSGGGIRVFNSDFELKGKSYVKAFLDVLGDNVWTTLSPESYDLINDNVVFQIAPVGKFVSIQVATTAEELQANPSEVSRVANMEQALTSILADKAKLDSLFADKAKLDSIFADKAKLDSLFADKAKLDSIFADKAIYANILADKTKLDSIFADKAKLDSLFADKAQFDAIFTNLAEILQADDNASIATAQVPLAQAEVVKAQFEAERARMFAESINFTHTPLNISSMLKGTFSVSNTQLQLADGTISISKGIIANGANNVVVTKSGTISPVGGWL